MNQNMLYKIERQNPSFLITESADKHIVYVTSKEDDRIAVVMQIGESMKSVLILTEKQAKVLSEELPELLWMIGRGQSGVKKPRGRGFRRET